MINVYVSYPVTVENDLPTELKYPNENININQFENLIKLHHSLNHFTREISSIYTDKISMKKKNYHILAWNKLTHKSFGSISRQIIYVSLYELIVDVLLNDRQFINKLKILMKKDYDYIKNYRLVVKFSCDILKYNKYDSATTFLQEIDCICNYVDKIVVSIDMVVVCYAHLIPNLLTMKEFAKHLKCISNICQITRKQVCNFIIQKCQEHSMNLLNEIYTLSKYAIEQRELSADNQLIIENARNVFDLVKYDRPIFLKFSKLNDITIDYLSTVKC